MSPKFYESHSPKNHNCTSSVIIRNGKILLGLRHYHDTSLWVAPGGRCDAGEAPESTVIREIEEEIGVTDARIVRKLGEYPGAYIDETGRDHVFVFEVATDQEPKLMEPEKFEKWQWFGLNEIPVNLISADLALSMFKKALNA
ncbi:MAG: NUDIX hydrolase [Candidatus Yanofskybacteria bacterium]|nr:NUDIX hydrolase [Candidatus Yanofskybacteria bacterium]